MTLRFLPTVDWSSGGVVDRGTLDATATSAADRQLTVAAQHAPIRTVYGQDRLGAQIANVAVYQGKWVIQCVWGEGEIDSINDLRINDEALPAGATATHYTGTSGQAVNATLAAAISGYADALPGIAYSVIVLPADAVDGFPQIAATIKGQKVYDPRAATTAWSDNPALALRDFIVRAAGRSVDEASVTALANICDDLVGGVKRRTLGLTLDTVQEVGQWLDTLRTYASCWLVFDGDTIKLVPDRPRATDATLAHTAGQIKSISLKKRGTRQVPTCVRVRYTNTSAIPWRDDWTEADSGATPRRESEVPLPGIHNAAQATREAIERLNKLRLGDLTVELETFDESLAIEVGDVIEVSHPVGLEAKPLRVLGVDGEYGRYKLLLAEYDPAMYSDAVASDPTYPDTNLPSPSAPPTVTGLTLAEENFVTRDGTTQTRFRATWTAPEWPWQVEYRVIFTASGVPPIERRVKATEAVSDQVLEGVLYLVEVFVISGLYSSAGVTADATAIGKLLRPGDVPDISAYEAGGEVNVTIGAAIDKDLKFYELRYDDGSVTPGDGESWDAVWSAATFLDARPASSGVGGFIPTNQIPAGDWRLLVCALDSVGLYSAKPATAPVTVTLDASAFFVDRYDQTTPTLTNMVEYSQCLDRNRYFITEDGVSFAFKFTAPLASYTAPLATYCSVASEWLGEPEDFEQVLSGQWSGQATVEALSGAVASALGFSETGSGYEYLAGLSHKMKSRFARLRHSGASGDIVKVTIPQQSIRLDVVPREEVGEGTTSTSYGVTVFLENEYVATRKIALTPNSTTGVAMAYDAIGNALPNPADKAASVVIGTAGVTLTVNVDAVWGYIRGRHPLPSTGKWYWENYIVAGGSQPDGIMLGLCSRTASLADAHNNAASTIYYCRTGNIYPANTAYGPAATTGDIVGVAYDADAGSVTFYKNGTAMGTITGLSGEKFFTVGQYRTDSVVRTLLVSRYMDGRTPPSGYALLPYSFNVYAGISGTLVAVPFSWQFQGV